MTPHEQSHDSPYLRAYDGRLLGILRWQDLDALWAQLQRLNDGGWYVYAVGEPPPTTPASQDQFEQFLAGMRHLLLDEHKEDYCGIVYADDHERPGFVKIFDPNNLGSACGFSKSRPFQAGRCPALPRTTWSTLFRNRGTVAVGGRRSSANCVRAAGTRPYAPAAPVPQSLPSAAPRPQPARSGSARRYCRSCRRTASRRARRPTMGCPHPSGRPPRRRLGR